MSKLIYSIACAASPLEIAAQALTVLRVQEYAPRKGQPVEELQESGRRQYRFIILLDGLNSVLDELHLAGLLLPLQEITGKPAAHFILHERSRWLHKDDQ